MKHGINSLDPLKRLPEVDYIRPNQLPPVESFKEFSERLTKEIDKKMSCVEIKKYPERK